MKNPKNFLRSFRKRFERKDPSKWRIFLRGKSDQIIAKITEGVSHSLIFDTRGSRASGWNRLTICTGPTSRSSPENSRSFCWSTLANHPAAVVADGNRWKSSRSRNSISIRYLHTMNGTPTRWWYVSRYSNPSYVFFRFLTSAVTWMSVTFCGSRRKLFRSYPIVFVSQLRANSFYRSL